MKYSRYILGTMELSKVHLRYIISGTKKVCYLYVIYVPILYQIGHISDIFGNPVQNRYTFFVPVKMYQFCTFFWCGNVSWLDPTNGLYYDVLWIHYYRHILVYYYAVLM